MKGIVQSGGTPANPPVQGGQILPLQNAKVTLYRATNEPPLIVGTGISDATGSFTIDVPDESEGPYYAIADVPSPTNAPAPAVRLLAIIGSSLPESITINELTTVGGIYAAMQLYDGEGISGSRAALRAAFAMARNLVSVTDGQPSNVLLNSPNGDETNALRSLRSLANLLAPAVRAPQLQGRMFLSLCTPKDQSTPLDTLCALWLVARNPAHNVAELFSQSTAMEVYRPALRQRPDAWTLAVKVNDSGDDAQLFGGPANIVFDTRGRAWIPNNTIQGKPVSSPYSMVLEADGTPAKDNAGKRISPFTGMGLLGAGFGIDIDSKGQVWVGDFGWGGDLPQGGVSVFTPDAKPVQDEILTGGVYRAQQILIDRNDNVWIASWGSYQVVIYPGGRASSAIAYPETAPPGSTFQPFGIAFALNGATWVTSSNGNTVSRFRFDGERLSREMSITVGKTLKGVVVDDSGYVWVASGGDDKIYRIDGKTGQIVGAYDGGGVAGPWGIALDGDGNVWSGNFGPLLLGSVFTGRLSCLASSRTESPGQPLTPPTGYTLPSAGDEVRLHNGDPLNGPGAPPCYTPMSRTTGLNIDAAGNVWVTNNWKPNFDIDLFGEPLVDTPNTEDGNPGGDGIVIFVGIAKPPARWQSSD